MRCFIFFGRNNEVLCFFSRKVDVLIFSEEIMRCFIVSWRDNDELLDFFTEEKTCVACLLCTEPVCLTISSEKMKCLVISLESNQVPHHFFRKNEVPHYFFRKKWGASLFLQKKSWFLSEEIMMLFIPFWRDDEAHWLST
jgi:hypothetical protein